MNTKVKVGIAAAIVAALVALIVLDQKTSPKDDAAAVKPAPGGEAITVVGPGADAPAPRLPDAEINALLENAKKQFGEKPSTKPPAAGGIKGTEEKNEKKIVSATG